ncbi:MAG: chorismate mutase [Candidatus Eremiobacterota bacterium]
MNLLSNYRKEVDEIDCKIIGLLKKREEIVKEIARCKVKENLPVHQPDREKEIYNRPDDEYIKNIYKIILEESRRLQNIIVSGE